MRPYEKSTMPLLLLRPDSAALGRRLHSWVQPDGAIHGFHNHSVWGDNPFRYLDFTAGHSTFASPFLPALAAALKQRPDARGQALLEKLMRFQCGSLQPDGQFAHIGFQVGETLKMGLIHNVVPCVALCEAVAVMGELLPAELRAQVNATVRGKVLPACDRLYPGLGVANQSYTRIWVLLMHMEAFGHRDWDARVKQELDTLIAQFHVRGLPDKASAGCLRETGNPSFLEPAEYYGLMIHPLLMAARQYQSACYLEAALSLARHVVRSSWQDQQGQRRLHRSWYKVDGRWTKINEPMLIGGMGITLSSIQALNRHQADAELAQFLDEADTTYAHYQSGAGFFLAASGWQMERDIIPSSAWQSHDLYHLITRHGVEEKFWDTVFEPQTGVAVVFGPSMMWMETGTHWAVCGYETMNGLQLAGCKDRAKFGVDIPGWIGSKQGITDEFIMPNRPHFLRTDTEIHWLSGRKDLVVLMANGKKYSGPQTA
jgi:hypothetical protein